MSLVDDCEPIVREVAHGWLATTPPEHDYRIGTAGSTAAEAVAAFHVAVQAWRELHRRDPVLAIRE